MHDRSVPFVAALILAASCRQPTVHPTVGTQPRPQPSQPIDSIAATPPGAFTTSLPGTSVNVDTNRVIGQIELSGETRYVYAPANSDSHFVGVYDPMLVAAFDERLSRANEQACFTVKLDGAGYRRDAMAAIPPNVNVPNRHDLRTIVRLEARNAVFWLARQGGGASPERWSRPVTVPGSLGSRVPVCFDVPRSLWNGDVQRLKSVAADNHQIYVRYRSSVSPVHESACRLQIRAIEGSTLREALSGEGRGSRVNSEVYVSRNQLATAILNDKLRLIETCTTREGGEAQRAVVGSAMQAWVPMVVNRLRARTIQWNDLRGHLVDLDYPGSNAMTRIDSWLEHRNDDLSSRGTTDISASGEADILGLISGSFDGQYFHDWASSESHDFRLEWRGNRIVPASLNVVVFRSGQVEDSVDLAASEQMILNSEAGAFERSIPIVEPQPERCREFTGTTEFASPQEIVEDCITFANGASIRMRNGASLALYFDRLSVSGTAVIDATGEPGRAGDPGRDVGPAWRSQGGGDYVSAAHNCRGAWDEHSAEHGGRGSNGLRGSPGGAVTLTRRPVSGTLDVRVAGGPGGAGGRGGHGRHLARGDNPRFCCYSESDFPGGGGGETGCTDGPAGQPGGIGEAGRVVYLDDETAAATVAH